jgi:hypothetical protein
MHAVKSTEVAIIRGSYLIICSPACEEAKHILEMKGRLSLLLNQYLLKNITCF